jgi:predicted neuraminidase
MAARRLTATLLLLVQLLLPAVAAATSWTVVPRFDADCSRSAAKKSTEKTLAACEAAATKAKHTVFSWNQNSHHCFTTNCKKFGGGANDHVTSGCLPTVPGCAAKPPGPAPPPPPGPPTPAPPPAHFDGVIRDAGDGSFEAHLIPPFKSNHAATIEQLPDGTLTLAWFSGAAEEANDCSIVFASLPPNGTAWSAARNVSGRWGYSNQNPVLFFDTFKRVLHLFHSQAPAKSGESTAQIWHLASPDSGAHFSAPAAFFTEPGDFPRNRIVPRKDGSVLFPYYSQGKGHPNLSVMRWSDAARTGLANPKAWTASQVKASDDLVQPSVVRTRNGTAFRAFFRDRRAAHIYTALSTDEGEHWTTPTKTSLPNNNAGIEAFTLSNGHIVLVFNDCAKCVGGRTPLTIAMSMDDGATWHKRPLQVKDDPTAVAAAAGASEIVQKGVEFSYPTVLQTPDGAIHVAYTYDRKCIKYRRFTEAWITAAFSDA